MKEESKIDWDDLLVRAKEGDKSAENELFSKLSVSLRDFAEYKLRGWSSEEVEDVIQNTLVILWQKRDEITSNPQIYAREILHNKIGHLYRKKKSFGEIPIDPVDDRSSSAAKQEIEFSSDRETVEEELIGSIDNKELLEKIINAIEDLPPCCRIFYLSIFQGYNRREIWEVFKSTYKNLKGSTYRKRISQCCRKKLLELLEI